MLTLEQILTLPAPHRFVAMVNIAQEENTIKYQVQTPDMVEPVRKTATELLDEAWKQIPIFSYNKTSLSQAVNSLRNEIARTTRRAVGNIVILPREELIEQCEFHATNLATVIVDDTLASNEIRAALAQPAGFFDAIDAPFAFTPEGNFANYKTVCGPQGYFARGFLND